MVLALTVSSSSRSLGPKSPESEDRELARSPNRLIPSLVNSVTLSWIDRQLRSRDISDERVIAAMAAVPRASSCRKTTADEATDDGPLPIGFGQTISQPYIVAWMTQELDVRPG